MLVNTIAIKFYSMKNLFLIAILTTLFWSCNSTDSTKKNIELIESYIEAVENLDYEVMDLVLDDQYLGIGPSKGDSINKENAIKNWKQNINELYEKIEYSKSKNIAVITSEGEWVSNWADLTITYKTNQKQISILANTIYQIKDGKIIKSLTFYNEADALEQLGYVFINPEDL